MFIKLIKAPLFNFFKRLPEDLTKTCLVFSIWRVEARDRQNEKKKEVLESDMPGTEEEIHLYKQNELNPRPQSLFPFYM